MKIGLALSGGGFRATLYHLGLVRFFARCTQVQASAAVVEKLLHDRADVEPTN